MPYTIPHKKTVVWLFAFAFLVLTDAVHAQDLGGGSAPDISIWRVILALLVSLGLGIAAILFLRARGHQGPSRNFRDILALKSFDHSAIEIADRHRVGAQSELILVKAGKREYLILNASTHALLIDSYPQPATDMAEKDEA